MPESPSARLRFAEESARRMSIGPSLAPGREYTATAARENSGLNSMDGSHPAVEASECAGQHERHEQDARSEHKHMPGVAQVEAADTADEQVGDSKVEKAPQHIEIGRASCRERV